MSDDQFQIVDCGIDSSGRRIRMTRRAKLMFDMACEDAKVDPVIVQGSFMGEGSAAASAGTHELAGCIDTRTWDLTDTDVSRLIHAGRSIAAVNWWRQPPAFDEHMHWLFLGDQPMHPDAQDQVVEYKAGGDGLIGSAPDPHWRPSPLVTTFNYAANVTQQEDDMDLNDPLFPDRADSPTIRESLVSANQANRKLDRVLTAVGNARQAQAERDRGIATDLERIAQKVSDAATTEQLQNVAKRLRGEITENDNPEETQ